MYSLNKNLLAKIYSDFASLTMLWVIILFIWFGVCWCYSTKSCKDDDKISIGRPTFYTLSVDSSLIVHKSEIFTNTSWNSITTISSPIARNCCVSQNLVDVYFNWREVPFNEIMQSNVSFEMHIVNMHTNFLSKSDVLSRELGEMDFHVEMFPELGFVLFKRSICVLSSLGNICYYWLYMEFGI